MRRVEYGRLPRLVHVRVQLAHAYGVDTRSCACMSCSYAIARARVFVCLYVGVATCTQCMWAYTCIRGSSRTRDPCICRFGACMCVYVMLECEGVILACASMILAYIGVMHACVGVSIATGT